MAICVLESPMISPNRTDSIATTANIETKSKRTKPSSHSLAMLPHRHLRETSYLQLSREHTIPFNRARDLPACTAVDSATRCCVAGRSPGCDVTGLGWVVGLWGGGDIFLRLLSTRSVRKKKCGSSNPNPNRSNNLFSGPGDLFHPTIT